MNWDPTIGKSDVAADVSEDVLDLNGFCLHFLVVTFARIIVATMQKC